MDVSERLAAIDFSAEDRATLKALAPLLQRALGEALAAQDRHASAYADYQAACQRMTAVGDDLSGPNARRYWEMALIGAYDADHARRTLARGEVYYKVKLPPRWSYAQFSNVLTSIADAILDEAAPSGLKAISAKWRRELSRRLTVLFKISMLELDLTATAYRGCGEAERVELEAKRKTAQAESEAVVTALSKALERVAAGDLTTRLNAPFPVQFERLREDFNQSIDRLRVVIGSVAGSAAAIREGVEEVARASDQMSERTEHQAANLEESAAALGEMTSSMRKAADGAARAREMVAAANAHAARSAEVVKETIGAMDAIAGSSRRIFQIVGVIDDIAFQTNLLALNAGVEAARAGEAGRGFAIVASEVRALALRSAEAAKEITALLSTSKAQVDSGVKLVGETGDSLARIIAQVAEINGATAEIARGAEQQAAGLNELNVAMGHMDKATQENAAMVEESNATTQRLADETHRLSGLVEGFDVEERGVGAAGGGLARRAA